MRKGEFDSEMTPQCRERKTKSAEQALQSLMHLCARGERSTGDALRLMRTWGVPEGERTAVVEKLVAQRYIDNRRYAEAYTREKSNLAGWGPKKIALQLRIKGIESHIIAETLRMLDDETRRTHLDERLRRKLRTTKAATSYELRGKLLRYALSLGYDYDMSHSAVERLLNEDDQ